VEIGDGVELRELRAVERRQAARELRAATRGQCFGGGGSSSASSSTTTTTNQDRRQVVEQGVAVSSDTSTVHVTALDGGAIGKAFDFAQASGLSVADLAKEVFTRGFTALEADREFVSQAGVQVAKAYDDAKGEGTQKFMIAVGVAAVVAVVAVQSFGGRK